MKILKKLEKLYLYDYKKLKKNKKLNKKKMFKTC